MQIFKESLFFKLLTTIQQKTVKTTYLVSVWCQEAGRRKRLSGLTPGFHMKWYWQREEKDMRLPYITIFRLKMLVGIRRLVMNVLPEGNLVFRTTGIDPGAETVNWSSSMHLVVLTLRSRKNFVVEGSVVISTSFYLHVLFHVDVQFAEDTLFHFSFSLSLSLSLSLSF